MACARGIAVTSTEGQGPTEKEPSESVVTSSVLLGSGSALPLPRGGGLQQSPEALAMLRAAVQAAQAVGIDPTMAIAAMPLLPDFSCRDELDTSSAKSFGNNEIHGHLVGDTQTLNAASFTAAQDGTAGCGCTSATEQTSTAAMGPVPDHQHPLAVLPAAEAQPVETQLSLHDQFEEEQQWEQWRRLQQIQHLQQFQQQQMLRLQEQHQQHQTSVIASQVTAPLQTGAAPQVLMQLGTNGGLDSSTADKLKNSLVPASSAMGSLGSLGGSAHILSGAAVVSSMLPAQHAAAAASGTGSGGTEEFTCTVCRKVFKRAANLIFHMTEHRPVAPPQQHQGSSSGGAGGGVFAGVGGAGGSTGTGTGTTGTGTGTGTGAGGGGGGGAGTGTGTGAGTGGAGTGAGTGTGTGSGSCAGEIEPLMVVSGGGSGKNDRFTAPSGVGPVKCTDCDKEFATKYQVCNALVPLFPLETHSEVGYGRKASDVCARALPFRSLLI